LHNSVKQKAAAPKKETVALQIWKLPHCKSGNYRTANLETTAQQKNIYSKAGKNIYFKFLN
jgi:hypothetical protein